MITYTHYLIVNYKSSNILKTLLVDYYSKSPISLQLDDSSIKNRIFQISGDSEIELITVCPIR